MQFTHLGHTLLGHTLEKYWREKKAKSLIFVDGIMQERMKKKRNGYAGVVILKEKG
jgi:hypothetical protein